MGVNILSKSTKRERRRLIKDSQTLDDGKKLFRDYGILAKNLVELGSVALVVDPSPVAKRKIVSLAKVSLRCIYVKYSTQTIAVKLVEHYCQKTLAKGAERTSDWEKPLSKKQQECTSSLSSLPMYSFDMTQTPQTMPIHHLWSSMSF